MNIDPIQLCTLLFNVATAHAEDFTYLKHPRPLPAFATTKEYKHFLSINFNLLSEDERINYARVQSESQQLVKFFNEQSHYKIKFSTAEHLLIKVINWIPILQIRFEIIGHDFPQDDPAVFHTFKSVWN